MANTTHNDGIEALLASNDPAVKADIQAVRDMYDAYQKGQYHSMAVHYDKFANRPLTTKEIGAIAKHPMLCLDFFAEPRNAAHELAFAIMNVAQARSDISLFNEHGWCKKELVDNFRRPESYLMGIHDQFIGCRMYRALLNDFAGVFGEVDSLKGRLLKNLVDLYESAD